MKWSRLISNRLTITNKFRSVIICLQSTLMIFLYQIHTKIVYDKESHLLTSIENLVFIEFN